MIIALVVPAPGHTLTEEGVIAHCRGVLAGFKCPRQYRFTASLPRLPTGKLLKRVVREEFGGSSAGSVVGT